MSQRHSHSAKPTRSRELIQQQDVTASEAALVLAKEYAKERPEVVALWAFGIGFILGWKLKPW